MWCLPQTGTHPCTTPEQSRRGRKSRSSRTMCTRNKKDSANFPPCQLAQRLRKTIKRNDSPSLYSPGENQSMAKDAITRFTGAWVLLVLFLALANIYGQESPKMGEVSFSADTQIQKD